MSMEMNKANECTCPSGDGSLVHPCPAHPVVEQAGGDERAEFERAFTVQEGIYFDDKRGEYRSMNLCAIEASDAQDLNLQLQGWQARAALAQPSPAPHPASELDFSRPLETENGDPVKWICADVIEYKSARVCVAKDTGLVYSSPYIGLKIRNVMPEQAEAERPEVVARVVHSNPVVLGQCGPLNANDELMTVAQHAASVARWAEMFNRVEQERDAALARVAEMEMLLRKLSTNGLMQFSTVDEEMAVQAALGGAPVAQAGQVPQAWLDVQAERRRQVEAEGWTPEHDDGHACDEIAAFACYYAMPPAVREWDASSTGYGDTLGEAVLPEGWEPKTGDRRRDLIKACALALAEIERLDRAAHGKEGV
ncbi:hypothetical protein [Pseudomonas aeruginosa]|uniref:hypothetical protein n=1 Tax=Pseudomonas aeruginosa TaxID=287 RepID=UPI003CC5A314